MAGVSASREMAELSGVVLLTYLPTGFAEQELFGYFRQFGKVLRVRVRRSKKGFEVGKAFVQFQCPQVAKIAAETMDNYILAERRIRCKVLTKNRMPKVFANKKAKRFVKFDRPGDARIRHAKVQSAEKSDANLKKQRNTMIKNLRRRADEIKELGIDYTYDFETKYKEFQDKQKQKSE